MTRLSIVTPAFNEVDNLPQLHDRICATLDRTDVEWEWIVVDDHSADGTFSAIERLAARDPRVRGLRLSRNSGSHTAIRCGVHHASGEAVALVAADLQDPPQVILQMLDAWRAGALVVWAGRGQRPGMSAARERFARLYYLVLRRFVGLEALPPTGADCFVIDRRVARALDQCRERHTSVFALIAWLGFRQAAVAYDKSPRERGASGWTLAKKIRLLIDSIVGFSDVLIAWVGTAAVVCLLATVGLAGVALSSDGAPGWGFYVLVLAVATVQLAATWILGQYMWRALDESRARPLWLIEAQVGFPTDARVQ